MPHGQLLAGANSPALGSSSGPGSALLPLAVSGHGQKLDTGYTAGKDSSTLTNKTAVSCIDPYYLLVETKIPGSVQDQAGQGLEQPDLLEGIPAHGRGVGTT
ncbi:hypothetical protein BTVI_71382 [Pitangus sulphuratus]|nr:hypothetical protein BTVI_71382 [Pitangus sulphuratus]